MDGESDRLPLSCNIFAEVVLHPGPDRTAAGIEGTTFKTHSIPCPIDSGFSLCLNHPIKLLPILYPDGVLTITVKERPTFSDTKPCVAVFNAQLLDVPLGGAVKVFTLFPVEEGEGGKEKQCESGVEF